MRQYCRYCAFCSNGNGYYCGAKEKVLSVSALKHENKCKDYVYSSLGDVDSGKQYRPQTNRKKDTGQINMFERKPE